MNYVNHLAQCPSSVASWMLRHQDPGGVGLRGCSCSDLHVLPRYGPPNTTVAWNRTNRLRENRSVYVKPFIHSGRIRLASTVFHILPTEVRRYCLQGKHRGASGLEKGLSTGYIFSLFLPDAVLPGHASLCRANTHLVGLPSSAQSSPKIPECPQVPNKECPSSLMKQLISSTH